MERAGGAPRDPVTIELDLTIFDMVARTKGWTDNAKIAKAVGVSDRQVSRIRRGHGHPGVDFIAGLVHAAPEVGFDRLFRIVPKSESIGKD